MIEAIKSKAVWVMAKGYAPDEGGMQTYAQAVAEAYAAAGARVTVFTSTSAGPRDTAFGPVRLVDVGPRRGFTMYRRYAAALRRERRRNGEPALLHATTWRTSVVPTLLGFSCVVTFHGREFMYPAGWKRWLMTHVAGRARRVVAVSRYSAEALQKRVTGLEKPPLIAWNGVTPGLLRDRVPDGEAAPPLVFSLCRLEPRKNLHAALLAAAACRDEGLEFRFVIGGRGPELERLRATITDLGLQDRVELAGFVATEKARQLYRDADIFIHPQIARDGGRDFEGFAIAIADAMYARTAVIIGRAGGPGELIEDGISGLYVDGNDQESVTAALRRLLRDASLRRALAVAAAIRAEREFDWNRHVATIVESTLTHGNR